MNLVHVMWDDDEGLVDLDLSEVIFYATCDSAHSKTGTPVVIVEDESFSDVLGIDDPTWDDVPALLAHPDFRLQEKTREEQ